MSCDAPEDAGGKNRTQELLESLGDRNWIARQEAVLGLATNVTGNSIQELLTILREQHRDLARLNSAIQVLVRTDADVVPRLLELLSNSDKEVRCYTALTLGERGDPRAISRLLDALADSDPNVRMHTVEALGRLRAAAAVEPLIEIVEALDFELAFPAIDALIVIGDERIANRLLPLLKESLFKVLAVESLGWLGDEESVKPLLDMLTDADVPPAEIATALCRIHERYQQRYGDDASIPEVVRRLATPANVQTLLASVPFMTLASDASGAIILSWLPGPETDAALMKLLDRPPIDREVVPALVNRGPSIIPLLLSRLATVNDDGRKAIIDALTNLGERSAVPALLQLLDSSDDEDLVVRIVDSLARLADARAYEPLRDKLGHPSARIRQSAVAAVNSLGHLNTGADLLPHFRDSSALIRESSVKVAAYLGLPVCLDSVFDCCGDPDERVRRAAIECLPTLDDPRVYPRLAQAIRTDTPTVRAAAAGALGKMEDTASVAILLIDALKDRDVWVRYFAVRSLLSIRQHERAIETLNQLATGDPAMQVRVVAIEALGECGPPALPVLLELSRSKLSEVANAAVLALGSFPQPEPKQVLLEAIRSRDSERQIQAIRALARTNSREFVEPLRVCVLGSNDRLAEAAAISLSKILLPVAATALIEAASMPARRNICIAALVAMSDAAVPSLASGLRTCELDTRRAIVEALAHIRSPEAIDALETALEDGQPAVRHAALSALAHIRQFRRM